MKMKRLFVFVCGLGLALAPVTHAQASPWDTFFGGSSPDAATSTSLFDGNEAAIAMQAFAARKGATLNALEITIYPERALVKSQDPAKPENIDQYTIAPGGSISDPQPVRIMGGGSLADNVFPIASVKFESVAALVKLALEKTNLEGGKVTHLMVKRNLPFSKDVLIRVYVSGTRKFAFIEADAQGNFKKVTVT